MRAPVFDAAGGDPALPPLPNSAPGYGALTGPGGNLPVESVRLRSAIVALAASVDVLVTFRNRSPVPIEATYVLPLPERAALSAMRIRTASGVVDAVLRERAAAREAYDAALRGGRRTALLEQERADVFTVQVGGIAPDERVEVSVSMHMFLGYAAGELLFRFPLVVGPRYAPGAMLPGDQVGLGASSDTDLVPDASRISPPHLARGAGPAFELSIEITVAPSFPFDEVGCTLPADTIEERGGLVLRVHPGLRADRDLVVRMRTQPRSTVGLSLATAPERDGAHGTFALTVLPPVVETAAAPRDVVVAMDNSSAMTGWRLAAARRLAARIIDTLTAKDRFAVVTFGGAVTRPVLVPADERNRFIAIDQLLSAPAGGDPLVFDALSAASGVLGDPRRPRLLLVIGALQTADDERIVTTIVPRLDGVRVHAIGVGDVVNGSLLQQLSAAGRGEFLVAESADALGGVLAHLRRLIGNPLLRNVSLAAQGMQIAPDTLAPMRSPDVFPGSAVVITGRWRGDPTGMLTLAGVDTEGRPWRHEVRAVPVGDATIPALWARAHLADLDERYRTCPPDRAAELERTIVELSLRYSVLTPLTAFVAVGDRTPQPVERVIAYVERPAGWSEPEPGHSAYAREYARRMIPTEPAPPPVPVPTGAYPGHPPQAYGAQPPSSGPPAPPGSSASAPQFGAPAPAPPAPPFGAPPASPRRRSHRGVFAGIGVAIVAAGVAIGGVAVTRDGGGDTSTNAGGGAPPATTMAREPTSPDATSSEAPPADLTVDLTADGSGTAVTATVSGVPEGVRTQVVVVARDGTREVVAESSDPDYTVDGNTSIERAEIASVVVEGLDGTRYATVEF